MNYIDKMLVRLANKDTRAALFDQTTLEQIAGAAYRIDALNLQAPYQAVFDRFELAYSIPALATFEGVWSPTSGVERTDAVFHVSGMGTPFHVDALWQGAIVARVASMTSQVTDAKVQLSEVNGDTVTEKVTVQYAPPTTPAQAVSRRLPISAALFIRDEGFSITELLIQSNYVRKQLDTLGLQPLQDVALPQTFSILVVWVIPTKVFNDPDWPGANPTARRKNAGQWLAREGIGLVVTA